MNTINFLILSLFFCKLFSRESNEKVIKTEANEVTLFLEGAQIISKMKIELIQGITILKFTDWALFIDPKSVQVKSEVEITVLSVNHQQRVKNRI
jgi:hypothetical protein